MAHYMDTAPKSVEELFAHMFEAADAKECDTNKLYEEIVKCYDECHNESGIHVYNFAARIIYAYVIRTDHFVDEVDEESLIPNTIWDLIEDRVRFAVDTMIPLLTKLGDRYKEEFYFQSGIALLTRAVQYSDMNVAAWYEGARHIWKKLPSQLAMTLDYLCLTPLKNTLILINAENESVHSELYKEDELDG